MIMETPHHNVSPQLLDTNRDDLAFPPLAVGLYQPGHRSWGMSPKVSADIVKSRANQAVDMHTKRPISPPAVNRSIPSSINQSYRSSESVSSDASNLTSVTLELRIAAKKTITHAKSRREINAAVPLHVQESMLENAFPHIRGNNAAPRSDSMKAEQSVDSSYNITAGLSPLDQVVFDEHERGCAVDYNDCIKRIPESEITNLRNAMHNYEKQCVMKKMEHLSRQMQSFHELLDEHHALKQEMTQVKTEKEGKVSDLEKTLIDMKLIVAQCQSREDHTRLNMARLEMDLKKANDENHRLQHNLGRPDEIKAARKNSRTLTKSLSNAECSESNVRSGEPLTRKNRLLTRSWFGKEGLSFMDRSNRGEDPGKGVTVGGTSLFDTSFRRPAEQPQKFPAKDDSPPKPAIPIRSLSFVDPKKARALKESEFMHWNSSERSDDEGTTGGATKATSIAPRSRSFVHLNDARRLNEPIGSNIFLDRYQMNDNEPFGSRSTILSNITDVTFEDGDAAAEEICNALMRETLLSELHDDRIPRVNSKGSYSTLTFEPAKPQLQHAMGLRRGVHQQDRSQLQTQLQKAKSSRQVNQDERPQLQKTMSLREHPPGKPHLQKAASLREREKGKLKSGDAYLAFC